MLCFLLETKHFTVAIVELFVYSGSYGGRGVGLNILGQPRLYYKGFLKQQQAPSASYDFALIF